MNSLIFENTRIAAYYLWEFASGTSASKLWACAEDFASYLERRDICDIEGIYDILKRGKSDICYINFVRNLSYRLYLYTEDSNQISNWYAAEKLLSNNEWCYSIAAVAHALRNARFNADELSCIRSELVKRYYS